MVEPAAGPPLHAFGRERLGIGGDAAVLPMEIDEPIAAVGVLHRVDDHDDLFEHLARRRPGGRRAGDRPSRARRRPRRSRRRERRRPSRRSPGRLDDRLGLLGRGLARVGEPQVGLADLIEAGQVLGAGDHQIVQPAFLDRLVRTGPAACDRARRRRGRGDTARSRHGSRCPRPSRGRSICLSVGTFGSASTSGIGSSQPGLSRSAAPAASGHRTDRDSQRYNAIRGSSRHRRNPRQRVIGLMGKIEPV